MKIRGETHYLWRAVDHEGEVLEAYASKTRNRKAALKFLRKAMRRYGQPDVFVTDRLPTYRAALREVGMADRQQTALLALRPTVVDRNRPSSFIRRGDESDRKCGAPGVRSLAQ